MHDEQKEREETDRQKKRQITHGETSCEELRTRGTLEPVTGRGARRGVKSVPRRVIVKGLIGRLM